MQPNETICNYVKPSATKLNQVNTCQPPIQLRLVALVDIHTSEVGGNENNQEIVSFSSCTLARGSDVELDVLETVGVRLCLCCSFVAGSFLLSLAIYVNQ